MGICVYIPTQKNLSIYSAVEGGGWIKDSNIPGRIGVIIASYFHNRIWYKNIMVS